MNARRTSVNAERRPFSQANFLAWLDEESTKALISEDHGQYYAYCVEFGISSYGRSKEEAVDKAVDLMMRYLVLSYCEGRSYREAKKAPPLGVRLRSRYLLVREKFLRGIKPPFSNLGGLILVPTNDRDVRHLAH
jgi:hypothetical protein